MITLDLSILNQKGTPMFNSDIFANRPTFGIAGRIFISTDTLAIYRDTGSAWDQLGGGGGGGTISGTIATGQVAFGTAANTIGGTNNLYWDNASTFLGINTNTPNNNLVVNTIVSDGGILLKQNNTSIGELIRVGTNNYSKLLLINAGVNNIDFNSGGFSYIRQNNFAIGSNTDTGQKLQVVGSSLLNGDVTFSSATGMFWDSTFNRLGIGTNTPADAIEINKNFAGGLYTRIRNTNAGIGSVAGLNLINDAIKTGGLYLFSSLFTPNGTRGPNTLTLFSGPDTNISVAVNSTGYFSIGTGNVETEKFRIFNNGNVLIQDGGTFTDGGQRLQVTGTSNFVGNITLPLNQNSATGLTISNNTSGTAANSFLKLQTTDASTYGEFAKLSSAYTTYKIFVANDLAIYNTNTSGDIAILNDFATGRIKFAAGGSATAQATLFSNGNFAIGSTTDTGQKLQVVGSTLLNGNVTFTSATGATWDSTNSRLGIGTNIPDNPLTIELPMGVNNSFKGIVLKKGTGSFGLFNGVANVNQFSPYFVGIPNFDSVGLGFEGHAFNTTSTNPALLLSAFNLAGNQGVQAGQIALAFDNGITRYLQIRGNGNMLLQNGGTFTDSGERLQITGTAKITDTQSYTTGTIQSLAIVKNLTINAAISASSGICNYVSTGDNGISSSRSVPDSTSFANIYAFNKYQFNSAGLTLTATQASPGVRTISQLFTQNVFKGANSGTITHMSGVQIGGYYNDNTGTITPIIPNAYQLLINDTGAYSHTFTFTNRWGIYQEGINDRNYLAGNLMLNSTTDTGQILQVTGAIRVNGQSSGTAGVLSGNYLIINVDGTSYKIALLNP
jgi:hypothetical protein